MTGSEQRRRAGGFALVAALIVLVILGSIGGAMVRLSSAEQAGSSAALLGMRADWAARSGIEWAISRARATGSCVNGTLSLTEGALSGFEVEVGCSSTRHREGDQELQNLVIRSRARFGVLGSADFVYREVEATILL